VEFRIHYLKPALKVLAQITEQVLARLALKDITQLTTALLLVFHVHPVTIVMSQHNVPNNVQRVVIPQLLKHHAINVQVHVQQFRVFLIARHV
jgi:hypothetical protein